MAAFDLAITGARVLTPEGLGPATVLVRGDVIADVRTGRDVQGAGAHEVVDAGDDVVMAGVVDTHVHINEPGRTEWEGFATATRAAASGGVTTLVDMPLNSSPVTTSVRALEAKADAASGQAVVDYAFWGGVVPGNSGELAALRDAGCVGFKCFMVDSGIDEFPAVGEADLRAAMRELARLGAPLLAHAESAAHMAPASAHGDGRSYARYEASRPPEAESEAVALLVRLCRETGCAVHVVHLACAEASALVAGAKRQGLPMTGETCPHYLTFASEDISDGATRYKCAPPIRGRAQREALWGALGRGEIDLIASDHSPCPPKLKGGASGDFVSAWGGVASLGLTLQAVWTGASARGFGLEDVARWMCARPAALAGLGDRKGRIAAGYDADFVVWSPEASGVVRREGLRFRHPMTPYEGMRLDGEVRRTFVRGVCVFDNGRFGGQPAGRWLRWSRV